MRYVLAAALDHARLITARRPIEEVIDLPETPSDVKEKLRIVIQARRFATEKLGLPDNGSYTTYVEVGRPELAWNVFAAPELSIQPLQWCFPVVGCVVYRGYSSEREARAFASTLEKDGYDTYLSRVTAYSTLGWFEDSVLSTFIDHSAEDLVATIFHELAHQQLYIPGDSGFNESFASVVEREGMRRWLASTGKEDALSRLVQRWREQDVRAEQMLAARDELGRLFASHASTEEKRLEKERVINNLRETLCELSEGCTGVTDPSAGPRIEINNAVLVAVGTYRSYVPGLEAILAESNGELKTFYQRAHDLRELSHEERSRHLRSDRGHR